MRVLDLSDIENGNITEIGYLDTRPVNDNAGYEGIWSLYPYFESGNILLSDREGLFIVKDPSLAIIDNIQSEFAMFPNPATNIITIDSYSEIVSAISIYDIWGKLLFSENNLTSTNKTVDISSLSKGIYFILVNKNLTKKLIKE
jgi:hypothetical protein